MQRSSLTRASAARTVYLALCFLLTLAVVAHTVADEPNDAKPDVATHNDAKPVDFKPSDVEPGLKEGFATPPKGYGEVPFWWWTGEKLDVDRLIWQVEELSISGAQVNYAHQDVRNDVQPNWLTYPNEPEVLTDEWFDVFEKVAARCRELNMGIGLSGYTLDWQNSPGNLFDRLIYRDVETRSRTLYVAAKIKLEAGERYAVGVDRASAEAREVEPILDARGTLDEPVQIVAYPWDVPEAPTPDFARPVALGRDATSPALEQAAATDVELWIYRARRVPCTLNPLHPDAGKKVVERFLQPFEDRAKASVGDDGGDLGLNYFFQDELQLGTGELVWHDDVADVFQTRKGYSYWTAAPAMFDADKSALAEKRRLDFMDVRVRLAEERYFIPIYNWHASRGRIYACDPGSRGRDPSEFCDYFSAIRWYTAPGHDTPGGHADFIKNRVSSSIAHFYDRPRVWLEGYHSFGWGATPERLLFATNENYLFGANLLNLHGLYYTTYGGRWEWAPPCYHFRQPYWETIGSFLKYFERLSFALTRGKEQTDFVVLYPVSAYQARTGGTRARDVAFAAAEQIFKTGRNALFIDDDSIARAEAVDGELRVAGGAHRALVLPSMKALRYSTLAKALEFYRSGGVIIALDAAPIATDKSGRDAETSAIVAELFGGTPEELAKKGTSIARNEQGGIGAYFSTLADPNEAPEKEEGDVVGSQDAISKLRTYPGGFSGHWVWSESLTKEVYFKWVAQGIPCEVAEYDARFFCDNAGALYVNGEKICDGVDYSTGWQGKLKLRAGDVVTLDGIDEDAPRRGSAGLFFALVKDGEIVATSTSLRLSTTKPWTSEETERAWRTSTTVEELSTPDVGNVHVLHRTGVNTEVGEKPKGADDRMWARFGELVGEFARDVYDVESGAPCAAMRRSTPEADIFFVMRGEKGAKLSFRAMGRVELLNAWDGTTTTPESCAVAPCEGRGETSDRVVITWPYEKTQAGLVVFWKKEPVELKSAQVADAAETRVIPTSKEWRFELIPTLNNRWGDFRLPASDKLLGAEAQRVDVDGLVPGSNQLVDYGAKMALLGALPKDAEGLDALERELSALNAVKLGSEVELNGAKYAWRPYAFSWRWGIEGNPGRQGYHGLKEKIDSRFIGLGKLKGAHNETVYESEESGTVYYLWSTVGVAIVPESDPRPVVDVYASGGAPTALYVAGRRFDALGAGVKLVSTNSTERAPILARYDGAGRHALVFVADRKASRDSSRLIVAEGQDAGAFNGLATGEREEVPEFVRGPRTPLSTIWFDTPGVLDYDLFGAGSRRATLSFVAPPGLSAFEIPTYGELREVLIDGKNVECEYSSRRISGTNYWQGARTVDGATTSRSERFSDRPVKIEGVRLAEACPKSSAVSIVLEIPAGFTGADACPEPIELTTEEGIVELGDWNNLGVLADYSGGARYTTTLTLEEAAWNPDASRGILDLGQVGASCRVTVNGEVVGDLCAAPWSLDVSKALKVGENVLQIETYNTLANFYRNIPTNYRTTIPSGLIGPVVLKVSDK